MHVVLAATYQQAASTQYHYQSEPISPYNTQLLLQQIVTHRHAFRMTGAMSTPPPTPTRLPKAPAAVPTPSASLRALANSAGSNSDKPVGRKQRQDCCHSRSRVMFKESQLVSPSKCVSTTCVLVLAAANATRAGLTSQKLVSNDDQDRNQWSLEQMCHTPFA